MSQSLHEDRTEQITIRVNPYELSKIQEAAAWAGETVEEHARRAVIVLTSRYESDAAAAERLRHKAIAADV